MDACEPGVTRQGKDEIPALTANAEPQLRSRRLADILHLPADQPKTKLRDDGSESEAVEGSFPIGLCSSTGHGGDCTGYWVLGVGYFYVLSRAGGNDCPNE